MPFYAAMRISVRSDHAVSKQ